MNNSSIKLSEHFTLGEMCKTSVKYKNVPNEVQVENLKRLCSWLEMRRRLFYFFFLGLGAGRCLQVSLTRADR